MALESGLAFSGGVKLHPFTVPAQKTYLLCDESNYCFYQNQANNVSIILPPSALRRRHRRYVQGSLTFEATTPRDAQALAYCLGQGASQKVLAEYVNPNLTPDQREVIAKVRVGHASCTSGRVE